MVSIQKLEILKKKVKLSFADKMMEILSAHPNMLKRINIFLLIIESI